MGSKGGGGGSSGSSMNFGVSNSTYTPNPEAMAAYRRSLSMAENVTSQPFQPYGGQMVAGFTPDQMNAMQGIREMQGITQPYINAATNLTNQAVNYSDPRNFNARTMQQYQNPYQQQVVDATMKNLAQLNAQQEQQGRSAAAQRGTFGGSGEFLGRAEIARQQGLANAQTLASLQQQGYQQAVGQYNQQQQQAIQTAQNAAYGLGQLGQSAQNAALTGIQALMGSGAQQRELQQQQLTGAYNQWLQAQAYPYQQAAFYSGIAGGIAPNMGGTTNTTSFGMGNQQQQQQGGGGGGAMGGLSSIMSMLPAMFSDRDDKTDIKKLGKDPESGEQLYAYRYKDDPKSYPKVVGPMAQDIAKHDPDRVSDVGGHKIVKGFDREHFADGGAGTGTGLGTAAGTTAGSTPGQKAASIYDVPSADTSASTAGLGGLSGNAGTGQGLDPGVSSFVQNIFDPKTADQMARAKWVNQPTEEGGTPYTGDNYVIPPSLMNDGSSAYPYNPQPGTPMASGGRAERAPGGGLGSFMDLVKKSGASGPFAGAPDNYMADAQQVGIGKIIPQGKDIAKGITESAAASGLKGVMKDAPSGGGGGGGGGAPKMPDMKGAKGAGKKPEGEPFKDPGAGGDAQTPPANDTTVPQQSTTGTPQTSPAGSPEVSAANQQAGQGGFDFAQAAGPLPEASPVMDQMNAAPQMDMAPAQIPEIPLLGFGFNQGGRVHKDGGGGAGASAPSGGGFGVLGQPGKGIGDIVLGDAQSPGDLAGIGDIMAGQEKATGENLLGKWNKQVWANDPGEQQTPEQQGMPSMPKADFYTTPRKDLPSVLQTEHYGEQNPNPVFGYMMMGGMGGKGGGLGPIGGMGLAGQINQQQDAANARAKQAELKATRESMLKDPANFPVQGYFTKIADQRINPRTGLFNVDYTGAYRGYPFKDGGRVGLATGGTGSFYNAIYGALLEAAKKHGAPHPEALARVGAAQSMVETGGGKHAPGNNFFGIKGPGGSYATKEVVNGKTIGTTASFRGYQTMQDSANDYVKLMASKPRYKDVFNAETPEKAIAAQARSGYATDPRYGAKLAAANSRSGDLPAAAAETRVAASDSRPRAVPYDPSKPSLAFNVMPQRTSIPMVKPAPGFTPASAAPKQVAAADVAPPPASKYPGSALNRINPKDPSGPLLGSETAPAAVAEKPKGFVERLAKEFSPISSAQAGDRGVVPEGNGVQDEVKVPKIDKGVAPSGGDHPTWNPNASTPPQSAEGIPTIDKGEAGPTDVRPGFHMPEYTYAPGVQEQAGPLTDFGGSARQGVTDTNLLPGSDQYKTGFDFPQTIVPLGSGNAAGPEAPVETATGPQATPETTASPSAAGASGQKYWGDWRDAEPWKSDPIGGFFDQLSGETPQASKPGTWTPGQSAGFDAGNLFGDNHSSHSETSAAPAVKPGLVSTPGQPEPGSVTPWNGPAELSPEQGPPMPDAMQKEADAERANRRYYASMDNPDSGLSDSNQSNDANVSGNIDFGDISKEPDLGGFARGGFIRKHFEDGGEADDSDPLSVIGQGLGSIGEGLGSAANEIGQGFGSLFNGGEQPRETASAAAAPDGQDFFTRWSENPLSQFLYHAGQAMSAHPNAHPLETIAAGIPGAITAGRAGSERAEKEAKVAAANAYQQQLESAGRGEAVEAPVETEAPEGAEAPTEGEEGAALSEAAPIGGGEVVAPRQGTPAAQPTAAAPRQAAPQKSQIDRLYERYNAIADMPATGAQIAQKTAAMNNVYKQIQLMEHREAGKQGKIGIVGTDEFGQPVRGWVSGPNVGQPLSVTTSAQPTAAGAPAATPGKPLTGDEYLGTLPIQNQSYIKGIASGEISPPVGVKGAAIKAMVKNYDPSWNEDIWKKRQTMRRAYEPEGKIGQQMNTASTALGHAERLLDTAERLDNYRYPAVNAVKNFLGKEVGNSAVTDFESTRTALMGEMEKYFKGGSPAEASVKRALEELGTNSSPQQIAAAVNAAVDLMQTKTHKYTKDWEKEFGPISESGDKVFPHDLEENERIAGAIKQRYGKIDPEGAKFYEKKEREREKPASESTAYTGPVIKNAKGERMRLNANKTGWEPF